MISCRRCVNIRRRVSIRCFRNGPSPTTDCVQGDHEEAGHVGRHVRAQPREVQGARPHGLQEGRAYAFVLICINTGTRNKEIRFAEVGDLDTRFWTFDIIHVKGEASYGLPRRVPIPPEVRPIITNWLLLRQKWLTDNSLDSPALFPSKSSDDGFLSGNSLRVIKHVVEEDLGIKFDLRQCRKTFGQRYLDKDLDIESVSVLMGHASTKTTEGFYSRKRLDRAIENAIGTWNDNGGQ